jgi:hypothetical protein
VRAFLTVLQQMSPWVAPSHAVKQRLLESLEAALDADGLSVTELGRNLPGRASLKHKVKSLWKRLRQQGQSPENRALYRALAHCLLKGVEQPVLLVDWTVCNGQYLLCCALAHEGRALPLFLELHPLSEYGKAHIEKAFLQTLQRDILPAGLRPLVCTDAGFRAPWFDAVTELGWDYLGRLTPNVQLQPVGVTSDLWVKAEVLGLLATSTPEDLGNYRVGKGDPVRRRVVRYHGRVLRAPSQRRGPSPKGGDQAKKHRRQAQRGWVLVSSLPAEQVDAVQLVALYTLRMQVEQLFRSVKSAVYGQGMGESRSQSAPVLAGLWQLACLRAVALHLVGLVAEQQGWHRHYQTNTSSRRVLSWMRLGQLVLRYHDLRQVTPARLNHALHLVRQQADRPTLTQAGVRRLTRARSEIRQTEQTAAAAA